MTAVVTDFNALMDDLANLIETEVTDFSRVTVEEIDINSIQSLKAHKHADIQLIDAEDQVRAGNEYITAITMNVVIAAYDLSSYKEAARLRNDLVRSTKLAIRGKPKFSSEVLSTITGRTGFADEEVQRGFIAVAVVEVIVTAFEGEC